MNSWRNKNWMTHLMNRHRVRRDKIARVLGFNSSNSIDKYIRDPKKLTHHQQIKIQKLFKLTTEEIELFIAGKMTYQEYCFKKENHELISTN